jgi:hypothetical protein
MRLLALALLILAAPACAQTAEKPDPASEPRNRRADSVLTTPEAVEISTPDPRPRADSVHIHTARLDLGSLAVSVVTHSAPSAQDAARLNAFNMHDDENTSVDAARAVIAARGGRLVELRHTGARNLAFTLGGQRVEADPNRIFTDAGRRRTLAALSRDTPAARAALAAFADSVLARYTAERPAVVVTLHNNTEANYGAQDYRPGGRYATDAAAVTLHGDADADDFFFVTDRALYEALAARGFNAVLQDNDAATDDGSLSVWAARAGVPYVNVEAQHGHADMQRRMIEALLDVLAR